MRLSKIFVIFAWLKFGWADRVIQLLSISIRIHTFWDNFSSFQRDISGKEYRSRRAVTRGK